MTAAALRPGLASALLLALVTALPGAAAAGADWCLPPVFEHGQRLHDMPAPTVHWLALALRQHQLCHAAAHDPDAPRAVLVGNSAVLGFPLPAEETLAGRLNQRLRDRGAPGQVFNLGWVNSYMLRDAVVLQAALHYRPHLIVYALTLADFLHAAPVLFPSVTSFFQSNADIVRTLADVPPPGLAEPLHRYADWLDARGRFNEVRARLHDCGSFVRAALRANAEAWARWADPTLSPPLFGTRGRQTQYDCDRTMAEDRENYDDWQSWNVLAYLETIHITYDIPILVLNWPEAHEPVGACYNVRYSAAAVDEFNRWLRAECERRGFGYLDLHDLLPANQFFDSLHPTAEGHRRIAERIGPVVESVLRERAAHADSAPDDAHGR
jgi:hypothetical protein